MYQVAPYLARRWYSNTDFTEWSFILERNVRWHDGTPFTAEDVEFWLNLAINGAHVGERSRAPAYYRGALGIARTEITPPDVVKIYLNTPNRFFPEVLADPRIKIDHPRHLMEQRILSGETDLTPLDIGLIGLGPFKFHSFEKGSIVRVRKFHEYFEPDEKGNKLPYLDGIDYVMTPDALAMDLAFRTSRLDGTARGFGHYVTEQRISNYEKDFGENLIWAKMDGGTFRLAFNVLKPGPWQDNRVRRAMALWINKRASIPLVLDGYGWTAPDISPGNLLRDKNFIIWPRFDIDALETRRAEARRLLEEAGYANGFTMGYLCRAQNGIPGGQYLKDQLKGLGIDLQLQIVDEGEWNRARVSLDYDSQSGNLSLLSTPESTEGVFGRFSKSPDSYAKHEDHNIDRFYHDLKDAGTYQRRVDVWSQLQRYLYFEQTYVIPIAEITYMQVFRDYVHGLAIPPEDGHTHTDYATVWIE